MGNISSAELQFWRAEEDFFLEENFLALYNDSKTAIVEKRDKREGEERGEKRGEERRGERGEREERGEERREMMKKRIMKNLPQMTEKMIDQMIRAFSKRANGLKKLSQDDFLCLFRLEALCGTPIGVSIFDALNFTAKETASTVNDTLIIIGETSNRVSANYSPVLAKGMSFINFCVVSSWAWRRDMSGEVIKFLFQIFDDKRKKVAMYQILTLMKILLVLHFRLVPPKNWLGETGEGIKSNILAPNVDAVKIFDELRQKKLRYFFDVAQILTDQAFHIFDADKDGYLSLPEFVAWMEEITDGSVFDRKSLLLPEFFDASPVSVSPVSASPSSLSPRNTYFTPPRNTASPPPAFPIYERESSPPRYSTRSARVEMLLEESQRRAGERRGEREEGSLYKKKSDPNEKNFTENSSEAAARGVKKNFDAFHKTSHNYMASPTKPASPVFSPHQIYDITPRAYQEHHHEYHR